ncbi:EcsC family protein [Siminovitchia sediminis]|uniref:EcsC family protein n=1 Tax=Siminovitchia sediminis TaxID=1274353 RepID=A0ABW4KJY4_9BACI
MMETAEQLQLELKKSQEWEKDQKKSPVWDKIGRLPFKILDKLTPDFLHKKIGVILDELGNYIQSGGRYLSSMSSLQSYYPNNSIETLQDLEIMTIKEMDEAVDRLVKNRKRLATVQGASTGFGGLLTLTIDIPFLLGLQLKTLQDIAMCYGYDPNDKEERLFIVKVLQFVSSDIVGKKEILEQLSVMNAKDDDAHRNIMSELQGWREVVITYRDQFGWKKMFQMVPVAGLVFGALINRSAIEDLSEAGMMLYRKRRISERLALIKQIEQKEEHGKSTVPEEF